jgi:hypothetical protein
MIEEIWKDIPGYEGIYQVSDLGNVKSLRFNKEKILKPGVNGSGYYTVVLCKGKRKTKKVHKLVAMAFLNHNPDGYKLVVDHKDNDKLNNILSNLQLISQRENSSKDKKGTSKHTGVSWDKERNKWKSSISINGKLKNLGRFNCELAAHHAYEKKLDEIK